MKISKKIMGIALSMVFVVGSLTACGGAGSDTISVVTREEGSGTRGAFVELTGVEEKDANGNKIDNTTLDAISVNSTSIVMTTVSGNENAIGYISLGSLNDTVKAVNIDGIEPTAENIINGSYSLARPFLVVTKDELSLAATDFMNFVLSKEGQSIVAENGYVEIENTGVFTSNGATGKIVIAGSSSVTPVMQKLQEAYGKINGNVEIEVQESDSTTGINATIEGTCEIGMASRELKEEEKSQGLVSTAIAMDGIVVIVHKDNQVSQLTLTQVKEIFNGTVTKWTNVK